MRGRDVGFTLVEVLVVLALIAIMATVSMPNLYKFYQIYKFNEYSFQIEAIIREAKIKSIETGQHVAVCISGRNVEAKLMGSSRSSNCGTGTVYKRVTIDDQWISISQNNTLLWDPRGLVVFSGNICMSGAGRFFKAIYQTNRGLVRTSSGSGGC